jgi:hypothetical protein
MTQTGGLTILFAWTIFGGFLAILAYLLLRHEKDPLQDLADSAADQPASPPSGMPSTTAQQNTAEDHRDSS